MNDRNIWIENWCKILLGPQQVNADTTDSKTHRKALIPINILLEAQPFHDVNRLNSTKVPRVAIE